MCAMSRMRPAPVPVKLATMLSPNGRRHRRNLAHLCALVAQASGIERADSRQALGIARAAVDCDEVFKQRPRIGPASLDCGEDRAVGRRLARSSWKRRAAARTLAATRIDLAVIRSPSRASRDLPRVIDRAAREHPSAGAS
jgi:hypothetical protein